MQHIYKFRTNYYLLIGVLVIGLLLLVTNSANVANANSNKEYILSKDNTSLSFEDDKIKESSFQGIFTANLEGNNIVTFNGGLKYVGEKNKTKVKHSEPIFSIEIKNNEREIIFLNKATNFNSEKTFIKNELLNGKPISTKLLPGKYTAKISMGYKSKPTVDVEFEDNKKPNHTTNQSFPIEIE